MEQKELKFRALDIKREKWIYFYLGENFNYIVDTVGQYIGRKDENKKEIYEGDLIKAHGSHWYVNEARVYLGIDGAQIEIGTDWISLSSANRVEIIGNIHQNKELLEK